MLNVTNFTKKLQSFAGETTKENVLRFFHGNDGQTDSLGVQFGTVFKLAKEYISMPLSEISQLLDSPYYEVRMGAVSIMDYQAKATLRQEAQGKKKTTPFDISTFRHFDRLNPSQAQCSGQEKKNSSIYTSTATID